MKFILNILCIGSFLGLVSSSSILTTSASCINSSTIATPCSTNSTNAWLDLYFVIDVSERMIATDLIKLSGQLATLFEGLTIGQTPKHSTRVGIITYASTATVRLTLTDCSNATLQTAVSQLQNYQLPNDSGTNIKSALETVFKLKEQEQSYRRMAVIIFGTKDDGDSNQIANILKEQGVAILTVAVKSSGALNPGLGNLSSPGYAYESTDLELFDKLLFAFTQINCVCPPRTNQFIVYNDKFRNYTKFADCVYGSFGAAVDPIIAVQDCENSEGILISVESKQKLDFLVDVVIASTMPNIKQFTIGAHRVNGQWVWFGYDDTLYCALIQDLPNNLGDYSYFNKTNGFNWTFEIQNGTRHPKPYVCQFRACDADYLCELSV